MVQRHDRCSHRFGSEAIFVQSVASVSPFDRVRTEVCLAQVSQLGADVTRRNLNIQPTIKVPVGYRFNVRVNRDILFEAPYQPTAG